MSNQNRFITPEDKAKKQARVNKAFEIKKLETKKSSGSLKRWAFFLITILIATMLFFIVFYLDMFFDKYDLKFQNPVRTPVWIEERDVEITSPLPKEEVKKKTSPTPTKVREQSFVPKAEAKELAVAKPTTSSDAEIARYIASKDWDYNTAIRIAKSENFWNLTRSFDCTRVGKPNRDGTRDYGLYQINDVHRPTLAKMGLTMEDMLDCQKNIDFAHGHIYSSRQNWTAWSAYNNGSYATHSVIEL